MPFAPFNGSGVQSSVVPGVVPNLGCIDYTIGIAYAFTDIFDPHWNKTDMRRSHGDVRFGVKPIMANVRVRALDYAQLRRTRAPMSIGVRAGFAAADAATGFGQALRSNLSSKAFGIKRVRDA